MSFTLLMELYDEWTLIDPIQEYHHTVVVDLQMISDGIFVSLLAIYAMISEHPRDVIMLGGSPPC